MNGKIFHARPKATAKIDSIQISTPIERSELGLRNQTQANVTASFRMSLKSFEITRKNAVVL